MRAATYRGPQSAGVVEKSRPPVPDGWVLVAPEYFGVCGTDLHIWEGHHPRAEAGVTLGHEFVGRVAASDATLPEGSPVFVNPLIPCGACPACVDGADHVCARVRLFGIDADGGAAEFVAIPSQNLVPLPDFDDLLPFTLTEPASVCVRAVRRSRQRLGDSVLVVGAGPIGLMIALASRKAGAASVLIAEPSDVRARAAQDLGFSIVDPGHAGQFHVVYDCTGHPSVAPSVLDSVQTGGTLVDVGLYREPTAIDLPSLMRRELTILGTHVYRPSDVRAAIDLIGTESLPVDQLISSVRPLEEIQNAFESIVAGHEIKVVINPRH